MDQKLINKLNAREKKGTLRSLSSYEDMVDFISNDYLGLSRRQFSFRTTGGSTGARLISGNRRTIEAIETELAHYFGFESALCFNSGYDANLGIFSSIPQRGDVILFDELVHASVRDGIRLGFADAFSFRHNDVSDLERLIVKHKNKTVYVAVEGLYSMTGDLCPIEEIHELVLKHNAYLIIDEAHAAGVIGAKGRGLVSGLKEFPGVFIKLVTFGKAFGSHGASVFCSSEIRSFLINFARPFIYSTALPPFTYTHILQNVTDSKLDELRNVLQTKISLFRKQLPKDHLLSDACSPIQIIRRKPEELKTIAARASDAGIALKIIYPPTVPPGEECIRVCLHTFNTEEEINKLMSIIQ